MLRSVLFPHYLPNAQILQLLLSHYILRLRHRLGGSLRFRKGDHVSERAGASEKHYEPVQPERNAAKLGYIDDVIRPAETRRVLIRGLEMLWSEVATTPGRSTETFHFSPLKRVLSGQWGGFCSS